MRATNTLRNGLLAVLFAIPFAVAAVADAVDDDNAAVEAYEREDFEAAEALFRSALADGDLDDESRLAARGNLGILLNRLERWEDAIPEFGLALQESPDLFLALQGRGVAFSRSGRAAEALADFEAALSVQPGDAVILNERGLALTLLDRHAEAAEAFEQALQSDGRFAAARVNLRAAYVALGQEDRLHELDAADAVERGKQYRLRNQIDLALAEFGKAANLDPANADALFERGRILIDRREYEAAIADYDVVLRLRPEDGPAHYNRGLAQEAMGRFAEAVADDIADVVLRPGLLDTYSRRASTLARARDYNAAVEDFTFILIRESFQVASLRGRGYASFFLGDFSQTANDFGVAVRDTTQSPSSRLYSALWSYVGSARAGRDGVATLGEQVDGISSSHNRFRIAPVDVLADVWPGPVAAFYLGSITSEDLMTFAVESADQSSAERLAEITFYLGEFYLERGDIAAARAQFEKTLATGVTSYVEYDGAAAELARVGP